MLGVPIEAIDFDYRMSEEELLPEKPARMAEITSIGLSEEFATCPAGVTNPSFYSSSFGPFLYVENMLMLSYSGLRPWTPI